MFFYRLLAAFLWPFFALYFFIKACRNGGICRVIERFGFKTVPAQLSDKRIWIHAASLGEVNSVVAFANYIKKTNQGVDIIMTTITSTGAMAAENNGFTHQYFPIDVPMFTRRFLRIWRPSMAIFMDSEIWPNTVECLCAKNIPIVMLNARLSNKSFEKWKKYTNFFQMILSKYRIILPQSATEYAKFKYFNSGNVIEINNLKYSIKPKQYDNILSNRIVFMAASTHNGEESIIINVHKELKKKFPNLLTILAPRHPDRCNGIIELLNGLNYQVHTKNVGEIKDSTDVYLVDTFGELDFFYNMADIAFIGGSLVPVGGHNMFEAAVQKCAIIHGNCMHNFTDMAEYFSAVACEVSSEDELIEIISEWIGDQEVLEYIKSETFRMSQYLNNDTIIGVYSIVRKNVQDAGILV